MCFPPMAIEADAFRALTRQTTFRRGEGLPGRVWESCRPAWIADVQLDDNFPRLQAAVEDGLRGAIALPLTTGGQFMGVLELLSQERRAPDDEGRDEAARMTTTDPLSLTEAKRLSANADTAMVGNAGGF